MNELEEALEAARAQLQALRKQLATRHRTADDEVARLEHEVLELGSRRTALEHRLYDVESQNEQNRETIAQLKAQLGVSNQ